jgi:chromosome partitioning protein
MSTTTTSTHRYSRKDERKDRRADARLYVLAGARIDSQQDRQQALPAYARQDVPTASPTYGDQDARTDGRQDGQTAGRQDRQTDGRGAVRKGVDGDGYAGAFVIVLANHKGGVTKTTSTANLGALFAEVGLRVLLVDCDPQANLSETFGWTEDRPGERLEDLLENPEASHRFAPPAALREEVAPSLEWRERLRIIPTTDALADVAADLPGAVGPGYESRLREVLEPLRGSFDVILLDTPPGLGTLPGLALLAADGLLIPALAADLDVRGAGKVYDLVETQLPDLRILGVLVAASESRWRITREAVERMASDSMRVLPVWVPRSVRVASAPRHQAPTAVLEPDSMVTHAYRKIVEQLVEELGL